MGVATTPVTFWSPKTRYVYPSVPTTMTFSSSSVNDTEAGTGMRTMAILGLAADYGLTIELVTLDGQNAGNSAVQWLRLLRLFGVGVGSSGENEGTVYLGTGTVTAGVPATTYALIDPLKGESLMAVDTVPAGKRLIITSAYMSSGQGKTIDADLFIREPDQCWRSRQNFTGTQSEVERLPNFPIVVPPTSDIEFRGNVDLAMADVACGYEGYWEDVTVVE